MRLIILSSLQMRNSHSVFKIIWTLFLSWDWPIDRGRVAAPIHILSPSWVYFLILRIKKKSNRSYLFFPHPSGSSWPPLVVCTPTLEATGVLASSPQVSPYPSRASLPCNHLPISAQPFQNTLFQSAWPLPTSSPLFVPSRGVPSLLPRVHPRFVHLSHGLLPSSSSPDWSHSAPNPWNTSRLHCTFFCATFHLLICLCSWALTAAHRPEPPEPLISHRGDGELIRGSMGFFRWCQVLHPQSSPQTWGSSWAVSTDLVFWLC